jgi:serine/threonine-protein kinase
MEPLPTHNMIGQTLAERFVIEELLGAGGTASVYKALDTALNKRVAVKVLHGGTAAPALAIERLRREVRLLSGMQHPNVLTVQAVHHVPDVGLCVITDLIEGETLSARLARSGPLQLKVFKQIFQQVCLGIAYAHSKGVIHRDIKPSNIMLTMDGAGNTQAIVVDFGLSKSIDASAIQRLTQTGEILGSLHYMSPEQCSGGTLDQRSDVYSLGCTMYESLSGRVPFLGESEMSTIYKHMDQTLPALESPDLSAASTVLQKCTAIDPAQRFASVDAVWQAIETGATVAVPNTVVRRRAAISPFLWLTAILLSAAATAFWALSPGTMERKHAKIPKLQDSQTTDEIIEDLHNAEARMPQLRGTVEGLEQRLRLGLLSAQHDELQYSLGHAYELLAGADKEPEQKRNDLAKAISHIEASTTLLYNSRPNRPFDVMIKVRELKRAIASSRGNNGTTMAELASFLSQVSRPGDVNALYARVLRAQAYELDNNNAGALAECRAVLSAIPGRSGVGVEELWLADDLVTTALSAEPDRQMRQQLVDVGRMVVQRQRIVHPKESAILEELVDSAQRSLRN